MIQKNKKKKDIKRKIWRSIYQPTIIISNIKFQKYSPYISPHPKSINLRKPRNNPQNVTKPPTLKKKISKTYKKKSPKTNTIKLHKTKIKNNNKRRKYKNIQKTKIKIRWKKCRNNSKRPLLKIRIIRFNLG